MCIITISLFSILSLNNLKKSLEKQYKNESQLVLKQTLSTFEDQASNIENILEQLSQASILKSEHTSIEEITTLLQTSQKLAPTNGRIFYGKENGGFYQGEYEYIPSEYNPVKQKWYKLAKEGNGEIIWTEPYLNYMTQEIVMTAAKPVEGSNGLQGVIAIDFNLVEMSKDISTAKIGEKGLVMLLNRNGTIIANRDNLMISESLFGNQFEQMKKDTNQRYVPFFIQDKEYLLHSGMIRRNGMIIVTAISMEEISQNLIKSHLPIFIVAALCLLIFGMITYIATLRGVRPLDKLGTLMSYVEKGDYDVTAHISDYKEISRLAKGFNSMIKAIKRRDERLWVSNQELKIAEGKLRYKYDELKESQRILKESEEKILRLVSHDSLTGLLNRRSLLEILNKSFGLDQDQSLKAVIFIDLDNFKNINDSLGHSYGDKVLIEVANKLKALSFNKKDVARISGDEFIIVIHELTSIEEAEKMAKEIKSQFDFPILIESKILNVTASVGLALYPIHAKTPEELLKIADMTMYHAKGAGKNGYKIFDDGVKQVVEEKLIMEQGIRECIERDEFELFFQPIYNTKEGRITRMEALLRTHTPSLSQYNISQIIQTAESTGQIIEVDKWVIKHACIAIQKINQTVQQPLKISINISAIHIMQLDFVDFIKSIVEETGVSPEWIGLEITETSLMESFESNKKKLEQIKEQGISIYLDDFGTGYSSLSYLNSLPIDHVKIDKSFIDVMLQSEKDRKIVKAIIKLAHNIGLHVVAEGVESKEQFETLQNNQCESIQGYYISKPVRYEEIISMIQEENGGTVLL
jgi:diguanylate cyclase